MKTPTPRDLHRFANVAAALARQAGEILRQGFAKERKLVHYKGRIDPVTEYDNRSERFIVSALVRRFPSHAILTEEGRNRRHATPYQWIIDPLDGTVNYAHGFPVYCVSIGLLFDGQPVAGVVFDPERKELFSAVRGSGARRNGRPIDVSAETRLERALVATGFAYDIGQSRRNNLGLFARMAREAQGIRRPGSAAIDLCWLACGRLDGFWELKLHPWDTAAASLIVTEAGGRISRLDGRPYHIFAADLLASNGHLHVAMTRVLSHKKRSQ